jgi:hypothetical protein
VMMIPEWPPQSNIGDTGRGNSACTLPGAQPTMFRVVTGSGPCILKRFAGLVDLQLGQSTTLNAVFLFDPFDSFRVLTRTQSEHMRHPQSSRL